MSIDVQKRRCLQFLQAFVAYNHPDHVFDVKNGFYVDDGVSGIRPIARRPGGGRLCLVLKPGDVVVMTGWDRGFRDMLDFLITVEEWKKRGITVCAANLPLDCNDPIQYMVIKMMAMMADAERAMYSKRRKEHVAEHIKAGRKICNHVPIGYKTIDCWCVPCAEEREVCKFITKLVDDNEAGFDSIASLMHSWITEDREKWKWLCWRGDRWTPDKNVVKRIYHATKKNFPYYGGHDYETMVKEQAERSRVLYSPVALETLARIGYMRDPDDGGDDALPKVIEKLKQYEEARDARRRKAEAAQDRKRQADSTDSVQPPTDEPIEGTP